MSNRAVLRDNLTKEDKKPSPWKIANPTEKNRKPSPLGEGGPLAVEEDKTTIIINSKTVANATNFIEANIVRPPVRSLLF